MNRIPRLVLVSMVVITLLGTFASPVLANTIENYLFVNGGVVQITCANDQIIIEDWSVNVDIRTFYDNNGEFFMQDFSGVQTGKIYLKDEPWKVIYYENEHWKEMIKPTGVNMSAGIMMKITIPGYGMVFKDIGRIVYEFDEEKGEWVPTWMAGQHEFVDPENYPYNYTYAAACDYLTSLP